MEPEDGDGRARRAAETREVRRAQILDAAIAVFAEKGFHGASITDVVSAAGVARGTFYLYFDSKEAIFRELLDALLRRLRAQVVGVDLRPGAPTVLDQLTGTVERIFTAVESNRALTRIIFREAVALDAAVDAQLAAFYRDLVSYIERTLEVGMAMGFIRPLDARISAHCILGCFRGIVQALVVETDAPLDVAAVARAVVDHNLYGVSARDT